MFLFVLPDTHGLFDLQLVSRITRAVKLDTTFSVLSVHEEIQLLLSKVMITMSGSHYIQWLTWTTFTTSRSHGLALISTVLVNELIPVMLLL